MSAVLKTNQPPVQADQAPAAIEFELDGRAVQAHVGETILQAAERHGVEIPRLCYTEGLRADGKKVASIHLRFLQPMQPGIKEIMQRFKKVMTIETNYSDNPSDAIIDENNRRYAALATLLRSRYLVDVDCWTEVRGQPIKPSTIRRVLQEQLQH